MAVRIASCACSPSCCWPLPARARDGPRRRAAGARSRRARVHARGRRERTDPREGLPLTRAELLGNTDVVALADGSLAFTEVGEVSRIGTDGLIHDIPDPGVFTDQLAARPDGTLLAVSEDRVRALAPGATAWDGGFPLRRIPFSNGELGAADLAALPDGLRVRRLRPRLRRARRDGAQGQADRALPRGARARAAARRADRRRLRPRAATRGLIVLDGTRSSFRAGAAGRADGLAALPDGTLLATGETLRRRSTRRVSEQAVGGRGARPRDRRRRAARDGAARRGRRHRRPGGAGSRSTTPARSGSRGSAFDAGADLLPGGGLRTDWLYGVGSSQELVRVAVPAGVAVPRPLAAVAPPTYETLGAGRVAIATSFAGRATS